MYMRSSGESLRESVRTHFVVTHWHMAHEACYSNPGAAALCLVIFLGGLCYALRTAQDLPLRKDQK